MLGVAGSVIGAGATSSAWRYVSGGRGDLPCAPAQCVQRVGPPSVASFTDDLPRARELKTPPLPPSFQWAGRTPIVQPLVWLALSPSAPASCSAAAVGAIAMSAPAASTTVGRFVASSVADSGSGPVFVVAAAAIVPFVFVSSRPCRPVGTSSRCCRRCRHRGTGARRDRPLGDAIGGRVRVVATPVADRQCRCSRPCGPSGSSTACTDIPTPGSRRPGGSPTTCRPGSVLSAQAWDDQLPLRLPGLDADQFLGELLDLVSPDASPRWPRSPNNWAGSTTWSSRRLGSGGPSRDCRPGSRRPSTSSTGSIPGHSGSNGWRRSAAASPRSVAAGRRGRRRGVQRLRPSGGPHLAQGPRCRSGRRSWRSLDPIAAANAVAIDPTKASANGLLLPDDEIARNPTGPTYDHAFDTDGSTVLHVIGWFVVLELMGVAAFVMFAPLVAELAGRGMGPGQDPGARNAGVRALFIAAAWLHVDLDRTSVGVVTAAFVAAGAVCVVRRRALLSSCGASVAPCWSPSKC